MDSVKNILSLSCHCKLIVQCFVRIYRSQYRSSLLYHQKQLVMRCVHWSSYLASSLSSSLNFLITYRSVCCFTNLLNTFLHGLWAVFSACKSCWKCVQVMSIDRAGCSGIWRSFYHCFVMLKGRHVCVVLIFPIALFIPHSGMSGE